MSYTHNIDDNMVYVAQKVRGGMLASKKSVLPGSCDFIAASFGLFLWLPLFPHAVILSYSEDRIEF